MMCPIKFAFWLDYPNSSEVIGAAAATATAPVTDALTKRERPVIMIDKQFGHKDFIIL